MSGAPISSSERSMPFPPGTVLAGKYRVERLLGEGGMGWVVVATHLQLEQRVALKFMRATQATASPEAVGRFLREARAAARIQSEHVARVADVGTLESGAPYLVMEYLEGQDLDSLLASSTSLPVAVAVDYAMQACEGLGEVHAAGIVHRDLKPANLFLARRSDGSVRVKLLDFGISKVTAAPGSAGDGGMTSTQALMGSPLYMAPEQMRSSKRVDARADIWSMGVILYEMLGGRSPFGGETLPEVCARIMAEPPAPLREARADVPLELEGVVMRCLEKDAARRFQDVAALARALAPFGQHEQRGAADRIGRVMRAKQLSLGAIETDAVAETALHFERRSEVAQTAGAFGTAAVVTPPRRSPTAKVAIGCAAIAVAVGLGIVATRGRAEPESAAAVLVGTAMALPSPGAASPLATGAVTATATLEPLTTATIPVVSASASAAPSLSRVHTKPKAAPAPSASANANAKPVPTSAFGGRD